MVDRIRALLLARQLSPTQFADTIGVARPIVSHILSGRNKPSLEVVQKLLAAFPDLSMPWLLSGTGPMLAPATVPAGPETAFGAVPAAPRVLTSRRAVAPTLVAAAPAVPGVGPRGSALPVPETVPAAVPAATLAPTGPLGATGLASSAGVAAAPASVATLPPGAAPAENLPPELALFAELGKTIRRIVIFYRDGTFADYQPE